MRKTRRSSRQRLSAMAVAIACFYGQPLSMSRIGAYAQESPVHGLRDVRVLVVSQGGRVRVRTDGPRSITGDGGTMIASVSNGQWVEVSVAGASQLLVSGCSKRQSIVTVKKDPNASLWLSIEETGGWSKATEYPGSLEIRATNRGSLRVINHVNLERYVGIVVAHEVWPTFETEALRGQAIAARGFVLSQMLNRSGRLWDVMATQRSQVYRGIRNDGIGRRALAAARDTRGLVCTWLDGDRQTIVPTYYSAACGGASQSAAIFGKADDIGPLSGGVTCDYCRIAPGETYRWGPVRMALKDVFSRLVRRYPRLRALGTLQGIEVVERTPLHRPVRLRLLGSSGQVEDMLAEHVRLAVGGSIIRSTDCDIRVTGGQVVFDNGRGFGHGLGLCQWGMQGQAKEGKRAGEILRYYFPGVTITRVY